MKKMLTDQQVNQIFQAMLEGESRGEHLRKACNYRFFRMIDETYYYNFEYLDNIYRMGVEYVKKMKETATDMEDMPMQEDSMIENYNNIS